MQLISLNTWGGKYKEKIKNFIKEKSLETDIFCFQEVFLSSEKVTNPNGTWSDVLGDLKELLPNFSYYFSPVFHNRDYDNEVDYPLSQGQASFWKKELSLKNSGEVFVHYKENERHFFENGKLDPPRAFQYFIFDNFLVINLHGYWSPAPKSDTPERIKQSEIILDFVKKYNLPKIITGDFNLRIDTKSLLMFEENGFRNLVKDYNFPTTRSELYDIKWRANDPFADYILVSEGISIKDFKVLPDVVSDHLPLMVDFELN